MPPKVRLCRARPQTFYAFLVSTALLSALLPITDGHCQRQYIRHTIRMRHCLPKTVVVLVCRQNCLHSPRDSRTTTPEVRMAHATRSFTPEVRLVRAPRSVKPEVRLTDNRVTYQVNTSPAFQIDNNVARDGDDAHLRIRASDSRHDLVKRSLLNRSRGSDQPEVDAGSRRSRSEERVRRGRRSVTCRHRRRHRRCRTNPMITIRERTGCRGCCVVTRKRWLSTEVSCRSHDGGFHLRTVRVANAMACRLNSTVV